MSGEAVSVSDTLRIIISAKEKVMSRKISKHELCWSCRTIHPMMNDGPFEYSIEQILDSSGYEVGYLTWNFEMVYYLENNGGCKRCIDLFKSAT